MISSIERRAEKLRHSIQQQINLADDELDRLQNYFNNLKSEICQVNERIKTIRHSIKRRKDSKDNLFKCSEAQKRAIIAQLSAQHFQNIQKVDLQHSESIQSLQIEFEQQLDNIQLVHNNKIQQKISLIEKEIDKTRTILLNSKKNQVTEEDFEFDENNQEIKNVALSRIITLENAIKAQNKDRTKSLQRLKSQLFECITSLEDSDMNQKRKVEQVIGAINQCDMNYQEKLKKLTRNHSRVIGDLKRKLNDAEKKSIIYSKSIQRTNAQFDEKISSLSKEREYLSKDFDQINNNIKKSNKYDIIEITKKLNQLQQNLSTSEDNLYRERTINENLKREIFRIKSEQKISKRRRILNI